MLVLGLDFETTGLDPITDEIIEVGAVLWDVEARRPLRLYSQYVKAQKQIPAEITRLTGIRQEDVERWGISEANALTDLAELAKDATYIVGHNGQAFDRLLLEKALLRHSSIKIKLPWIDTLTDLPVPDSIATRKLTYLAAEHGFVNPFSHRAVFDVLTMLKVFAHYTIADIIELQQSPLRRVVAGVSFDEREKAKNLGFRWDPGQKQWYLEIKECQMKDRQFPFPVQVS